MVTNLSDLALEDITEDFLIDEAIEMGTALNVDTRQGSIYRDAADGHILRTAKFFEDLSEVWDILSVNTCTGDVLDEKLKERGLSRNPEADTQAIYYVEFNGAHPELGELCSIGDYLFTVDKIDDNYVLISQDTGTDMNNFVAGTAVIPENDVDDLISATLGELYIPAVDMENDDSARTRLLNKISGPDENGNASQLRTWAESVEGVGKARVIPLWNGPMTVKIVIIEKNGGVPAQSVVDAVQEYIDPGCEGMGEGVASIGQFVTVVAAQAVNISVSVSVVKKAEATYEEIKDDFEKALKEYFKELATEDYSEDIKVRYNKISAILVDMPSVIDHDNLLVNGGEKNISFSNEEIPVLLEVTVNGGI